MELWADPHPPPGVVQKKIVHIPETIPDNMHNLVVIIAIVWMWEELLGVFSCLASILDMTSTFDIQGHVTIELTDITSRG